MGIVGRIGLYAVGVFFIGERIVGQIFILTVSRLFGKVAHGESRFVATTPVVFEFSATPNPLEFGFTGRNHRLVIEVP